MLNIKTAKKYICVCLMAAILLLAAAPAQVLARQGDSGYEGGISSGEAPNKISYQYQEPCFLTGTPIILSGTLLIKKSLKTDAKTNIQTLTTRYTYTLGNTARQARMTRNLTFVTTIAPQDNGQKIESTQLSTAVETLTIDGTTYRITNISDYELSKSILNDIQPAVNYYAGELWSKKTYRVGATANTNTITVESTGKYYGYDGYWSNAEAQLISQEISVNEPGKTPVMIGRVDIDISTTTKRELKYYENKPNPISFEGGYTLTQKNENILKYTASLSELDKNKKPTSKIVKYQDSLKYESFPVQERLVSPNLKQIKGHPSEGNIALMFGLGAFKDPSTFNPQEYMNRAEFIDAFVKVAKEVPVDPVFASKTTSSAAKRKVELQSPFSDVSTNHYLFAGINEAAMRGITAGRGVSKFRPNELITMAEAVTLLINSLGLEGLAPGPAAVTSFKDNDNIPSFARAPMYVAEKLGLIQEDSKGYIYPNAKITNAKAADMMKIYIDYVSSDIRKEYRERLIGY